MDGNVGMGRMVDWPEILLDLRRHGWTLARVAQAINAPKRTVSEWGGGREPRFSYGLMLLRLHGRVVSQRSTGTRFAVQVSVRR
jgi:hypothetical protein